MGLFGAVNNLRKGQDSSGNELQNYNNTWCGRLAGDKRFEVTTMIIISLNAIVIGYDADYTARFSRPDGLYDGPAQFILFEMFFTVYFSAEILVRFIAFKRKLDCLRDRWFVFDGLLVLMMVLENLVIETIVKPNTGGESPVAGAASLRLLRILRITRMTRLMRSFPELMTIIKGLAASVRSVLWTGVILFMLTYTWAVVFTSEFHQGKPSDQEILDCAGNESVAPDEIIEGLGVSPNTCAVQVFFGSMGKSMASLLVMGAVLDDVTACSDAIRKSPSPMWLGFFLLYIVFASFTLLNMLTGILCEVVNATSEGEKVKGLRLKLKEAIDSIVESLDHDMDGCITKDEFKKLRRTKRIQDALSELDIDNAVLQKYYEYFYGDKGDDSKEEKTVHVDDMTQTIMRTRPGISVSALHLLTVKQAVIRTYVNIVDHIEQLANLLQGRVDGEPTDLSRGQSRRASDEAGSQSGIHSVSPIVLSKLHKLSTAELVTAIERRMQAEATTSPPSAELLELMQEVKVQQAAQLYRAELRRMRKGNPEKPADVSTAAAVRSASSAGREVGDGSLSASLQQEPSVPQPAPAG